MVGLVSGAGGELRRRGFAVVDDVAGRRGGRTHRAGRAVRSGRPDAGEEGREEEVEEEKKAGHLGYYWVRYCKRKSCPWPAVEVIRSNGCVSLVVMLADRD